MTVILFYQAYIGGAVGAQVLADYRLSFLPYAVIGAATSACGAIAALVGGFADKVGRANLVVYGLIACSLVTAFWIPRTHSITGLAIAQGIAAATEGIVLVATPALVRDFSPQVGRAQAMGFWTMGPVLGSLLVSGVSSRTLDHLPNWRDQYVIAGFAGLAVSVVALIGLRELNAVQRNRIVGAIEADTEAMLAARGLGKHEATRQPFRQMLKPDILASSFAISVFLLFYYTAVSFLPIFFQTVEGFTPSQSNSLLNWLWATTAASMVCFGVLSDKLRVRKPFMLVGSVMTVVVDIAFIAKVDDGRPSYASIALLLALSGLWAGAVYVPWMASFTETIERRNPALTATGLAVWGWVLRLIVATAFFVLPQVVSSVTPLVNDAPAVQARANQMAKDFPQLYVEAQAHPEIFRTLASYPDPAKIPSKVLDHAIRTVGAEALTQLQNPRAQADLKYLSSPKSVAVQTALAESGKQWKQWLWACTAGVIIFIPLIFVLAGAWRPRRSHDDEHAITATNILEPAQVLK
ncbi:MFS transporter [Streptomyces chartreusis]|uniref:MFS transporter n=1 Tax=Streptomyces chartreusis TaxID=1969 RepID=UPI0036C4DB86